MIMMMVMSGMTVVMMMMLLVMDCIVFINKCKVSIYDKYNVTHHQGWW